MKAWHVVINPRWAARALAWGALMVITVFLSYSYKLSQRVRWLHHVRQNNPLPVSQLPARLWQMATMCAHGSWPTYAAR